MYAMSGDEVSERLIVGLESFLSLGIAFLSTVTGTHIPPLSTPAICHLYGSDTPTTEFFLEKSITPGDDVCVASDWLGTSLRHVLLVRYFSRSESHHVCVSFCFPVLLFQFLVCHAVSWWSRWLLWDPMAKWYFHVPEMQTAQVLENTCLQLVSRTVCLLCLAHFNTNYPQMALVTRSVESRLGGSHSGTGSQVLLPTICSEIHIGIGISLL
jgi:hypothetical protein